MTDDRQPPTSKPRTPWQLIAIVLVTLVPLIAAYVAYYTGWGVPDETVNEGLLLQPPKDTREVLRIAEGEMPTYEDGLKWRLFVPVPENCDEACQQNLYITRQVHIRLADKADRIERYAVNVGGAQGQAYLASIAADHPKLKHFSVPHRQWRQWLMADGLPVDIESENYYFLVDPNGFAMMVYTTNHDGNQLLKDVKRILRHTPDE